MIRHAKHELRNDLQRMIKEAREQLRMRMEKIELIEGDMAQIQGFIESCEQSIWEIDNPDSKFQADSLST